jgi:nucleoside-diphosphate-sugar epimerase
MKVALTGATGFIGSHILTELREHGHEVTALVRDDDQADVVAARGATPSVVDLHDRPSVTNLLGKADGAIHTASPGDATSANLDSAVVDAAVEAFAGTCRPYLHVSGLWIYGANPAISEESPMRPPALVAWKEPIERRVLDAAGMRGAVIVSGSAYGDGGGAIPGLLLGSPRNADGNLIMIGSGGQHWPTVHVADLADVFRRVLEDDSACGYYVIGNGVRSTVAELTEAAAVAVGAPGAVPGSDAEARARLGDYLAEVLLHDQATTAARARSELGWEPSHATLVDEFRHGSYRRPSA